MKKRICLFAFIGIVLLIVSFIIIKSTPDNPSSLNSKEDTTEKSISTEPIPETVIVENDSSLEEAPSIQIIMVGDMLMHERVMESGLLEDGTYNFDHIFVNVKDTIENADLAIVNQETILGGSELGLSGYPAFNSPYELGDSLVNAGFDVILHATNHTLDKGKTGVLNCMNFWDNNYPNITYLGINKSQEEWNTNIFIYEQEGIKIAILNYTYGTNGINPPSDMPYIVNYLDE